MQKHIAEIYFSQLKGRGISTAKGILSEKLKILSLCGVAAFQLLQAFFIAKSPIN